MKKKQKTFTDFYLGHYKLYSMKLDLPPKDNSDEKEQQ